MSKRAILLGFTALLAIMLTVKSSPCKAYDFSLGIYGPQHVAAGHSIYLQIESELLEGQRDYVFYDVLGLSENAVASYPELDKYCCGGNRAWSPGDTLLKLDIPSTAQIGLHSLKLSAESGGITKEAFHSIQVDGVPEPLSRKRISNVPPFEIIQQWEYNMITKGGSLCDEDVIANAGTWEGNIWYYDGIRVYYQIADYTGNDSWQECAGYVRNVYRPYVLNNNGAIQASNSVKTTAGVLILSNGG